MDDELIREAFGCSAHDGARKLVELIGRLASRLEERGREGAWRPTREEIARAWHEQLRGKHLAHSLPWEEMAEQYREDRLLCADAILALNPPAPPEGASE